MEKHSAARNFSPSQPDIDPEKQLAIVQVLAFQRRAFQMVGCLPSRSWRSPVARLFTFLITGTLFIGASAEVAYQFFALVLVIRQKTSKSNMVLDFLYYAPYIAESLRGLFCLLFLLSHRKHWRKLANFVEQTIHETFPVKEDREKRVKKWRTFAVTFGVVALCLHLAWEVVAFFGDYETLVVEEFMRNETSSGWAESYGMVEYWTVTVVESVTFCLSQQIFIVMVVIALVLKAGATALNERITMTRETAERAVKVRQGRRESVWSDEDGLSKTLTAVVWDKTWFTMECQSFNQSFKRRIQMHSINQSISIQIYYCFVPRCLDPPGNHPRGAIFPTVDPINQSSIDFHCKSIGWLIDWLTISQL